MIPVHGDRACWYRALAKVCTIDPMQLIKHMEEGTLAHKNRRNRTDGNFVTSINELDETRAQRKLDHYKHEVPLKDGMAVQFQPQEWWRGQY